MKWHRLLGLIVIGIALAACNGSEPRAAASTTPPSGTPPSTTPPNEGEPDPDVRALFEAYVKTLNDHELTKSQEFFAPQFILADPGGHVIAQNDEARKQAIAKEDAYYKDTLGMTSTRLVSIKQTAQDKHHVFVRTVWGCTFKKTGDRVIDFPLSFIVERTGPSPKIIMHIVEADEPKIFRENGLIP